jgi:hypothetical protein
MVDPDRKAFQPKLKADYDQLAVRKVGLPPLFELK